MTSARPVVRGALVLLLATGLGACGSDPVSQPLTPCEMTPRTPGHEAIDSVTFADSLGIDLAMMTELPSGVRIQDLVAGSGPTLTDGDTVIVSYTGRLSNGCMFDSGGLLYVHPPTGLLIQGWIDGTDGQQLGSTRLILIPPALGYGDSTDVGVIPAGSVLVFQTTVDTIY